MDENKQKRSFLQSVPDLVKGWLGLIIAVAGIIIAFRTDQQLYAVIFMGIILIVWLSVAIYVVFSRRPGTFSKNGIYRYESHRWMAFISIGFVIGFVFSFSLFTPNRLYVSQSLMGTPNVTVLPTHTFIPFTPTMTPLPSPTATPTPTPTLTPTPTPVILFEENFLNNNNGWDLPPWAYVTSYSARGKIIGGKLEYSLDCPDDFYNACENWLRIPHVTAKNFDLAFDTIITSLSNNAILNIGVKFRDEKGASYVVYFSNKGTVSFFASGNGLYDFIAKDIFSKDINQGLDETNHFRVVAQDATFTIYANEKEITRVEDGNISSIGNISLGIYLLGDSRSGRLEIDNILIQEVR